MFPVEIRRVAGAASLAHVAPEVFDGAIDPACLEAYLAEPNHLMLVAIVDGVVVGQCAAVIDGHPDKANEAARGLYRAHRPATEESFVMYEYDL
jgi:hypothetical protein